MPEKNDSFRKMNVKDKTATVAGITLLIILVAGFVLGIYFFGMAGIFKLLGVQYQSNWALVIFVASYFFLGMIVELFSNAILKLTTQNISDKLRKSLIRICFEFISNWLVLFTVDEFMKSMTLSWKTEIMIALLIALIEIALDNDKD
ncbi:regulatory YrvL family protein [Cytobacillus massiliigabonensis]|uniref:regulatory YrvL family protein n=1 Tax=Cytobacillus massiliigabonensis TaxID=1871011 RepID=UPI000C84F9B3|nr:regulatory YrvL family protein [Cytobacillus massiliigabonensis]